MTKNGYMYLSITLNVEIIFIELENYVTKKQIYFSVCIPVMQYTKK